VITIVTNLVGILVASITVFVLRLNAKIALVASRWTGLLEAHALFLARMLGVPAAALR